jgi:glycosyltransferase involved in cell wall biosynthesis
MNICFLEGDMSRRGGTERMTALLANELCGAHSVWVISLKQIGTSVFFPFNEKVRYRALNCATGKLGVLQQIREINRFVRKNQIDWLINVDVGMSIYGIPASWGTKTKVITWEHGNFYNNWGSRWFPYFRKFAVQHSDAMVVLTEKDRENEQKNISTKKPIYVIANPAEQHEFAYDAASKTILSAGLLLPVKGYDMAIQAASKVLPQHPEWRWVICGEGPERQRLEKLIRDANLEEQVRLLGTVSHMDEQYQKAALYVMTSKMEGLPMVLLEAKSWGLPIVSFDIMTGPSDIIRDGVNGFLVPPGDVDKLAERIEQLITQQNLREQFSDHSQLDMEKFDFTTIVKKWEEIMEGKVWSR